MADNFKSIAHRAGALYVIFAILGVIGEFIIPGFTVTGDAAATVDKIVAGEAMYRLGLLNGLLTLAMFIYLVVLLYRLFREVDAYQSLTMVLLVTVGVAISFANMYDKYAALTFATADQPLAGLSESQWEAITYGFLRIHGRCSAFPIAFWGLWLFPFGALVAKSGFFPRVLGYLLWVAGVGYAVTAVVSIGFPEYRETVSNLMMPLYFGELPIIFWMLIKGAREPKSAQT